MPKIISLHDVLEPLKQALLASRDVTDVKNSSQICGSNLQKVFTLGDGCWLPIGILFDSFGASTSWAHVKRVALCDINMAGLILHSLSWQK